jgi:hypothetical protein
MTRVTLNLVNSALEVAGIKAELIRSNIGGGYHYFIGSDVERAFSTSVYVSHTQAYSVAQWVELAQQLKTESTGRTIQ